MILYLVGDRFIVQLDEDDIMENKKKKLLTETGTYKDTHIRRIHEIGDDSTMNPSKEKSNSHLNKFFAILATAVILLYIGITFF